MRKTTFMRGKFCRVGTLFMAIVLVVVYSCKKETGNNKPAGFSYGDSILYLKNQSVDNIVYPIEQRTGQYFGFPDGIEIDQVTGAINVSKSESGLRYRVTYVSPEGDSSSTM